MLYCLRCSENPIICKNSLKCDECFKFMESRKNYEERKRHKEEDTAKLLRIMEIKLARALGEEIEINPEDSDEVGL